MNPEPLRVMQVVSNLEVGGAQEVVRILADYLARTGCVSLVCTFQDGPLRADIERLGIPVEILPQRQYSVTNLPKFTLEMLQIRRRLASLVQEYGIQVIQTHLLRSLDFLVLSLGFGSGPLIFWTFHNALFDLREDHLARRKWLLKPKRFSHHLLYRLGSHLVNGMVAVSDDVKGSILQTMAGIPEKKIHVICNRVDIHRYGSTARREDLRASLGFSEKDHVMALVATFKRQKGHTVLVQAAAEVIRTFPNLHLLLAGDGELRPEIESRVQALQIEKHFHFLGTRRDIPDLLAASDSFVLPSLWEGLPMALVEAMASGLPVVASEVSGTRQLIVSGENGLLVLPGDEHMLAQAMHQLLAHPEQARAMGEASRRKMETQWGAHLQAQEYIALYRQAMLPRSSRLVRVSGG